jgi:hypothetical protein
MGMIPSDLASRLRSMTESAVQPLAQVGELPSELPEFQSGQRFTATIQSSQPDGTYRALVAGRTITLSLPQGAAAGESLDLVMVDRTARSIIATRSPLPEGTTAQPSGGATLSRAGQLIGALLAETGTTGSGQMPEAAPLSRSGPILLQPPANGQALAPLLQNAIAESGVFYEAHQALWVTGKQPLDGLLREPQGRMSRTLSSAGPDGTTEKASGRAQSSPGEALLIRTAKGELARQAESGATAQGSGVPSEIAPVVRQQLEALSGHHIAWQGQIWPGQTLDWEIEDPPRERTTGDAPESPAWNTTLRLTLPTLGAVTARLQVGDSGVTLDLRAAERPSAQALQRGLPELARALDSAGVPLRASAVASESSGIAAGSREDAPPTPYQPPDLNGMPVQETDIGPD